MQHNKLAKGEFDAMLPKRIKHLTVCLLATLAAGCAAKNSECKIGLFNTLLKRNMPYVKKKINSAKPVIIKTVNDKINQIPSFDETIPIPSSQSGMPSNLKASIEFSTAKTNISQLNDDNLTLYEPKLDSSCRRLNLPITMSIQTTTEVPIFIDGIPNLNHYKKQLKCHFEIKKAKECDNIPSKHVRAHVLNIMPELTVTLNLKMKIDIFKKRYRILPVSQSDIKLNYECNDELPDIILGKKLKNLQELESKLKPMIHAINQILDKLPLGKQFDEIPEDIGEKIKDIGNQQCQQLFAKEDPTIKKVIAEQLNQHLDTLKGPLPKS